MFMNSVRRSTLLHGNLNEKLNRYDDPESTLFTAMGRHQYNMYRGKLWVWQNVTSYGHNRRLKLAVGCLDVDGLVLQSPYSRTES